MEQSHIGMKIQVRVLEVNLAQKQLYLSMFRGTRSRGFGRRRSQIPANEG